MPKRYTKKRGPDSKKSKPIFASINRAPLVKAQPFPRVLRTQVKYAGTKDLTNSIFFTATSNVYRLNSIHDPDQTGGGKTVAGHAALAGIYGRYLVTNAKVSLRFYDPSADGVKVGCRLRLRANGATSGQTTGDIVNQPMTYFSGLADSGRQVKTFELNVKPWFLMGLSKLEYMANTSKYSSAIAASPGDDYCWMDVFAIDANGVATTVNYTIKIVYTVELYDRLYLAAS